MSERNSLAHRLKDNQVKYVYYLLALAVGAIAFSVNSTMRMKISYDMLPLGIGVLCWLISIFCGIKYLQYCNAYEFTNVTFLDTQNGENPLAGRHPEKIQIACDTLHGIMGKQSNKTANFGAAQDWFLYIGTILFIAWRVIEML